MMEFLAENHPRLVHFPIALLMLYTFIEIAGILLKKDFLLKTAHLLLFFGVLGAVGAVVTGEQAEQVAVKWEEMGAIIPFKLMNEHKDWANILMWYFVGLLVIRTALVLKKKFTGAVRYVFIVAALIGAYFVYETGEHGGELVYKHGVGTELKLEETEE